MTPPEYFSFNQTSDTSADDTNKFQVQVSKEPEDDDVSNLGDTTGLAETFPFASNTSDEGAHSFVVYDLSLLSMKRPGTVLALGYGNPLKTLVKAADTYNVTPLVSTSTDDKRRAFSFGGTTETESVGERFRPELFENEYAVLCAAERCSARTIICASNVKPTQLMARECLRRDILLLVPVDGDKTLQLWYRAMPEGVVDDIEEITEYRKSLSAIEWRRCNSCGLSHDIQEVVSLGYKCPSCSALARLKASERMTLTFDDDSVEEWLIDVEQTNGLDFPDFDEIIARANSKSGRDEAVVCGSASIKGVKVAFGVMEPNFIMGSMGHVVGERLAYMFERATDEGLPAVVFCTSGGARMQEGLVSLMQMAKVSAAVQKHNQAGLLYISVLADPVTGGVTASFATLGDIILAEPKAIIGFAGRRVIKDTIKQSLPDNFQTAEFALEHGQIDAIVERSDMRNCIAQILDMHGYTPTTNYSPGTHEQKGATSVESEQSREKQQKGARASQLKATPPTFDEFANAIGDLAGAFSQAISEQTVRASQWWKIRNKGVADVPNVKPLNRPSHGSKTNSEWESVQLARNTHRPTASYYINVLFDDFIELHGDREFADDGAIVAGVGRLNGQVVTVIAEEKGVDLNDRIVRNFGCPKAEGYRKSMRLMKQAQKFNRPIICLVDTQGAFCGKEAEERNIGGAIAENLAFMSSLRVPVIACVIGEGGSGGALALAVANKVAMQENAIYSVLSPEGFASILWKDGSRAFEAAEVMKVSAQDALAMDIIDDVIVEGEGPAHENPDQAAAALWLFLTDTLSELNELSPTDLQSQRYNRFRKF